MATRKRASVPEPPKRVFAIRLADPGPFAFARHLAMHGAICSMELP